MLRLLALSAAALLMLGAAHAQVANKDELPARVELHAIPTLTGTVTDFNHLIVMAYNSTDR